MLYGVASRVYIVQTCLYENTVYKTREQFRGSALNETGTYMPLARREETYFSAVVHHKNIDMRHCKIYLAQIYDRQSL